MGCPTRRGIQNICFRNTFYELYFYISITLVATLQVARHLAILIGFLASDLYNVHHNYMLSDIEYTYYCFVGKPALYFPLFIDILPILTINHISNFN